MQVSDNFQRANGSLGQNWSTPVNLAGGGPGAGGIQVLNNAFAPVASVGGGAYAIWKGAGAGKFAPDQYASVKLSAIAAPTSVIAITAATQSGGNTTYAYTLTSGSPLALNQEVIVTGMAHAGNNGVLQIGSLGAGTFTAPNASGTTATESGTGTSPSDSNCGVVVRATEDGLNAYVLYVGTNSAVVAGGGVPLSTDNRLYDVELWKVVNGVAVFMAGVGGINFTTPTANDVFTLVVAGTKITIIQNATAVYQTTDASLSAGSPGIMTWSAGAPGEWANPTVYAAGNSGTQMTNWIGGDDNLVFTQLATDTMKEGTTLSQVVTDSFTRANGGLGSNWVSSVGSLQIVSGKVQVVSTGTSRNAAYWGGGQTFSNDQYAEVAVAAINNTALAGPSVRTAYTGVGGVAGESSYILLVPATGVSGSLLVQRMINGGFATILTVAGVTPQVGDVFRISAVGTLITIFQNGVSKGSVTDANLTKGFPGLFIFPGSAVTDAQFSSWAGGGTSLPSTFVTRQNQNWSSSASQGAAPVVLDAASTPFAELWQNAVAWPADQYAEAVLNTGLGAGPAVRISPAADTCYCFVPGSANLATLLKTVAGVTTHLVDISYVFNASDVFRIEAQGTTLICKINGGIRIVFTDSSIASGNAGLAGVAVSSFSTDWKAGSITAPLVPAATLSGGDPSPIQFRAPAARQNSMPVASGNYIGPLFAPKIRGNILRRT